MQVVITMAGQGSRFREVGVMVPKHEIVVRGKSLFEWAMRSLTDLVTAQFIFVVRRGQYQRAALDRLIAQAGIRHYQLVEIDQLTSGQAATVMAARSVLTPADGLAIYNIDTYVEPGQILPADWHQADGYLTTFQAPGDHWSFAQVDAHGKVVDVVEKRRVSNHASVGFYYFRRAQDFFQLYQDHAAAVLAEYGETYVAPFYHYFLADHAHVTIKDIPVDTVHVLGTPAELAVFRAAGD
ncbi:glycosyltransferase family 2 protein [Levilactobacillus angrenensis]|uniref:Glycosyltransferase family 2 protein n=1 Tax=Levilactobacillus angrenensis TaxID=2486020 RepID=A0ABW1U6D4_9LACO|nr:glycosyltransferase family 2 protein [Levilactobacillus angrenensis]